MKPESSEKQAEEKQRIEETVEQPAATADKEGKNEENVEKQSLQPQLVKINQRN